jgi:hypothetical protein
MAFRIRMPFKIVPYCSFVTQCFLDCIIWHEHESGKHFIATKETERVRQETLQWQTESTNWRGAVFYFNLLRLFPHPPPHSPTHLHIKRPWPCLSFKYLFSNFQEVRLLISKCYQHTESLIDKHSDELQKVCWKFFFEFWVFPV